MSALLVGYARCSTDQQDLTAQRDGLLALGVEADRIYVDHGLTGTNRERPGLREALAACRAGDTLVVTKLDRLARSLPDARAIADELTAREISFRAVSQELLWACVSGRGRVVSVAGFAMKRDVESGWAAVGVRQADQAPSSGRLSCAPWWTAQRGRAAS